MTWVGYIGWGMIALAVVAVLAGVLGSLPAVLRARRTSAETARLIEMYRQQIDIQVRERERLLASLEASARPLRRVTRVATHPLVLALLESYRMRRRRAREAVL